MAIDKTSGARLLVRSLDLSSNAGTGSAVYVAALWFEDEVFNSLLENNRQFPM